MGVVAGKAHAALERRVFDPAAGLEPGLIVATGTEFCSAERRTKGLSDFDGLCTYHRLRDKQDHVALFLEAGLN